MHVGTTITAVGMKHLECEGKTASVTHTANLWYNQENVKLPDMRKRNHLAMLAMAITPQVYDGRLEFSSKVVVVMYAWCRDVWLVPCNSEGAHRVDQWWDRRAVVHGVDKAARWPQAAAHADTTWIKHFMCLLQIVCACGQGQWWQRRAMAMAMVMAMVMERGSARVHIEGGWDNNGGWSEVR